MTTNPPPGGPPPEPNRGLDAGPPQVPPGQPPAWHPDQGQPTPSFGQPAPYGYAQAGAPGGPTQPPPGPGDVLGDQSGARSSGGRRAFVPWIIGLAVLLVIGGGAFAVRAALGGNGDQPAGALPAATVAYGRIDLDPSGSQKIAALRLANKFPGFAESTGITDEETDLRQRLWELIREGDPTVADIDYATDIEPWLGSRAAIAYVAPADGAAPETGVIVALQVTDQDAAEAGFAKLKATGDGSGEEAGIAFVGDYALIAMTQELADAYAADAGASSLADSEAFQTDMAALGEEGVASFWMSKDALELIAGAAGDLAAGGMSPDVLAGQGNYAAALRFDESYVEVAIAVTGADLPAPVGDSNSQLMSGLPDSTLMAFSTSYGSEYVDQAWAQFQELGSQGGANFDREIQRFQQQTGLSLPGDISTLLGDGFAFAIDSQGLDDIQNLEDPADLRIGALFDTDPAAAGAILDKLVAAAGGGLELETVESDGLLAVALNPEYAAELTGGSLGASEAFQNAVPGASDADFAFFFSMDALEGTSLYADNVDDEAKANLDPISAIGMSASYGDGVGHASLRVVIGG